jgi:adenine-specific DNA-methyltransferase
MSSELGQYFTTDKKLQDVVFSFIKNNPKVILEPSIGRGDLISYVISVNSSIQFDMYEIDKKIKFLKCIDKSKVKFGDFLKLDVGKKYDTIIGNPPFVRTDKGNLYIDFVIKCYELLNENGELIFIIPSDFLKLTFSRNIINTMIENGTFTDIYHPQNEKLFKNATIDILIFRYCKNKTLEKKVKYNEEEMYLVNTNGIVTFFHEIETKKVLVKDIFDVYVGIVSGKDNVFKNKKLGNIDIITGVNKVNKFIFINEFPSNNENVNKYLMLHKNELLERKIRKFTEKNWFQFGAIRNLKVMEENKGKKCIYMTNLTRKKLVAFGGNVGYFGGGLLLLIPKKECNLENIVNYFNSDQFKQNYMFSGRFKIGQSQLCNSYIESN